jgi:hypothetical protein
MTYGEVSIAVEDGTTGNGVWSASGEQCIEARRLERQPLAVRRELALDGAEGRRRTGGQYQLGGLARGQGLSRLRAKSRLASTSRPAAMCRPLVAQT